MKSPVRSRRFHSRILAFISVAASTYFLGGFVLSSIQRAILFPRHQIPAAPSEAQIPQSAQPVYIQHQEGRTEGWFFATPAAEARDRHWVVFAHGNGELIDYALPWVEGYQRLGYSVALFEYRGYGRSDGSPSETKILADFVAFFDAFVDHFHLDPSLVTFHGRSLGGGAMCALAQHRTPRALILESTFLGIRQLARGLGIPGFFIYDRFDNESFVRQSDLPIFVIHGRQDQIVPFSHGKKLAELSRRGRLTEYACGHNDLPDDPLRYWREIEQFLRAN